jgi:Spy/CpxP family protein refolding chaperone
MRKTLIALLVLPVVALAEGPKDKGAGPGPGPDPARALKRMQLARTLGLASVLDLDTEQALKLGQAMAKFDERRKAIREQARDARETLRTAATGGKVTAAEVDGAVAKLLDLRGQSQALDKEMLQAVSQGLSPQQKARAVLFLGSFRHRMDRHMMRGPGGPMGPGMMNGPGARGRMMGHGAATDEPGDHMALRGGGPAPWDDDAQYGSDDP